MHVEEHDIDGVGPQEVARDVHRPGLEHAVALELEVHPAEQPKRGLVVDDENRLSLQIHEPRQCR